MIEIPIQPSISADQTMRIELAGVMANIRFYYNTRSRHWMLDVANDMGKGMQGIKLVTNYPLFTQYRTKTLCWRFAVASKGRNRAKRTEL